MDMSSFDFRLAELDDAAAIIELIHASITQLCELDHQNQPVELADQLSEFTIDELSEFLSEANTCWLVLQNEQLLGVASINPIGEIRHFYIAPKFIHNGIGSALLAALELSAREQGLGHIMLATTNSARGFFRARGFIPTRPDYAEWLEKPLQRH